MGIGWPGSVITHGVVLMALLVTWAGSAPDLPPPSSIVPVEIIDTISDTTNVTAAAPEEVEAEETEDNAPEGSQQTMAPPEREAPEAVNDPRQKKKQNEKPKVTTSITDLQRMISLEKQKQGSNPTPAPNKNIGPTRDQIGSGTEMTATETDAINSHVQRCWRAPADLPYPERLIVKVRIRLNADGSLAAPPELVSPRSVAGVDPATRVAAEAAMRAVRVCDPFPVARNRTQRINAVLNFDPRLMAGVN